MLDVERREMILKILRQRHTEKVAALAKSVHVSEATMRRDLNEMERMGFIKRIHGGAVLVEGFNQELSMSVREQQNENAKRIIAQKASRFLHDGQIIFLDPSSTAMHLVRHFENFRSLTIITNGISTAGELLRSSHKVYCTGGLMLHNSSAFVGSHTIEIIQRFNADIFFFSSRGVSSTGLITDASSEETAVRRAMLAHSRKSVFLCDKSKMGTLFGYNLCSLSEVDHYITND